MEDQTDLTTTSSKNKQQRSLSQCSESRHSHQSELSDGGTDVTMHGTQDPVSFIKEID